MNVVLPIPDDLAARLSGAGTLDIARQALEALAAEGFAAGRLTKPELRRLLGFETGHEVDGFLKRRGIFDDYTMADLEEDRGTLDRLGL